MRVAERVLVNNYVITDDDIERIAAPFETGDLEGADEEMRRVIDRKTALNRTPEEIERMRPEMDRCAMDHELVRKVEASHHASNRKGTFGYIKHRPQSRP